jgi:hypothetical protein
MKPITALVGFAMLMLLAGLGPAYADQFQLTGSGTKLKEHTVKTVDPDGSLTVRILNAHPGYAAFTLYLSGEDSDGDEVILDYRARRGLVCAVTKGCITTLENTDNNLIADELTVVGIKGASGANARVTHCTAPAGAAPCTPPVP